MAGEATQIVGAGPIRFEADGQPWAVRQPTCEERDDARAVQRAYEALWRTRPEVQALAQVPPSEAELAGFDRAIEQTQAQLDLVEEPAQRAGLKARIEALEWRKRRWNQAEEIITDRGVLARDRWLTARLLLKPDGDGDWQPALNPHAPDFAAAWEALPEAVRDGARPAIWAALRLIEDARFFSAPRSAPASSSPSATGNPPSPAAS